MQKHSDIISFLLGAVIFGALATGLTIYFIHDLENPLIFAVISLVILILIAIITTIYTVVKKTFWKTCIGFEPKDNIDDLEKILEYISQKNYKSAVIPSKRLLIQYSAVKGRVLLLQFSLLLLAIIAGTASMGILYKKLNLLTEQNNEMKKQYLVENNFTKITLLKLDEQNKYLKSQIKYQKNVDDRKRKEKLLNNLFEESDNQPVFNSRIRENALFEYLKLVKPLKQENLQNTNMGKEATHESANSENQVNLSYAFLNNIMLTRKDLTNIDFHHVNFKNSNFTLSDFNASSLAFANFENAILTEVNLSNTTLYYTNFYKAKVDNVSWKLGKRNGSVWCCNIYGARGLNKKTKEELLSTGHYIEEENLTKWEMYKSNGSCLER